MKKVAWLLSFVMIVSLIFENVSLTAFAEGEEGGNNTSTPTFTISINDSTGDGGAPNSENKVEYKFSSDDGWISTQSNTPTPIDISDKTSITVKVTKAGGVNAVVESNLAVDNNEIMGDGQTFTLETDISYTLNVAFNPQEDNNNTNNDNTNDNNANNNTNVSYTVDFGTGSWPVGDTTVYAKKNETDSLTGQQQLSETDTIILTNFDANTMEVKIAEHNQDGSEGFRTTLAVTENKTSLADKNCDGLPGGTLYFSVVAVSTNNGNTEGGDNPPQNEQEPGTDADNPVKISFRGDASLGATAYKLGENGTWTTITQSTRITKEALSRIQTIYIKAKPEGTNSLDESGTGVTKGNEKVTIDFNSLKSDAGFALTYSSGNLYDITIEYKMEQGGGPEPGGEQTNWKLKLKIGEGEYDNIEGDGRYKISDTDFAKALNNEITVLTQQKNEEQTLNVQSLIGLQMSGTNKPYGDGDNRTALQIFGIAEGDNYITVNLQAHYEDLIATGVSAANGIDNFYITNVTFYKEGYKGIKVEQQGSVPDMFSSLILSDVVDISSSTQANPQTVLMYFANNTFKVSGGNDSSTVTIELADTVNPAAVSISGNTVTFNSNFYDEVTFKVTRNDVTGYVKVKRLGLTIQSNSYTNDGIANEILHGTQPGVNWSGTAYAGKYNIVGTFYYSSSEGYNDYHLIATLTYADGRVETKEVAGIGETTCVDNNLKGGDYILYSGTKENAPVKVSATAVKSGATTGESFGGACFGNGAGVTATFN